MEIFVLRHAIAEDPAPGQSDSDRRLTPQGKKKLRKILARARDAAVEPQMILTSPYLRAAATAEIAQQELGVAGEVVEQLPDETLLKLRTWSREILERSREAKASSSHEVERLA